MTEEGLNSTILRLQSLVFETYGMIKDIYRREQQEGDVDKIANLSLKLANYEGALLTLQGYKDDIIKSAAETVEVLVEEVEDTPDEGEAEGTISEEQLAEKSQSFRDSQKYRKKKAKKSSSSLKM